MKGMRRILWGVAIAAPILLSLAWACGVEDGVREYLSAQFWLPFPKFHSNYAHGTEQARLSAPFAGMTKVTVSNTPLERLRAAYQHKPDSEKLDTALETALAAAPQLSAREREEIELIDAKLNIREEPGDEEELNSAQKKLQAFLQTAQTPEYRSEARGWLARVYFLKGEEAEAGKMYLDELARTDSNLSLNTLTASLRLLYGYDGGAKLVEHLDEYFDTPAHAAFAIQTATNPRWKRIDRPGVKQEPVPGADAAPPYEQIKAALDRHRSLLRTSEGANLLASLGMRNALRAADPQAALRIAAAVSPRDPIRRDPDFLWMQAAAHFLTRQFAASERPLLSLVRSKQASPFQRATAAYALAGLYGKLNRPVEQLHYALWQEQPEPGAMTPMVPLPTFYWEDTPIYVPMITWDGPLLLDVQAPTEALREYLRKYPREHGAKLAAYSLAVRLARNNQYEEAAQLFDSIQARLRAKRMREVAALYKASTTGGPEAQYKLAEYLADNTERLYYNDRLWEGFQRYALRAEDDGRLTGAERQSLIRDQRKLRDGQEERWSAYQLLREIVDDTAADITLRDRAAQLAVTTLRKINTDRFGREKEIQAADLYMSKRFHQH